MNKLQFFAAIAAAMGVSYEELSEGRKRLVEDVYRDHLTVRQVAESDNILEAIGLNEERFNEMDKALSDAINNKDRECRLAETFKEFTSKAENPVELFAMGFMVYKGTHREDEDLPQMIKDTLEELKSNHGIKGTDAF